MQQVIKNFLWIVLLAAGLQASWAFSLLGPNTGVPGDAWQVTLIGYNPLGASAAPPYLLDGLATGPKNISEGYRRNAGYLVYACDANFIGFFGSNGLVEVDKAYAILNNISNVDDYSTSLTEFPLTSRQMNYTALALGLLDVKSEVLSTMTEQLGLADSIRYTWALHNRYQPQGAICTAPGPGFGLLYTVIMRNFDITASPLTTTAAQFPPYGQYSPYVNSVLYGYYIVEDCGAQNASPPDADAIEVPSDPLANNPPVASAIDSAGPGFFYNGLTRDDVAGLRYLISSNSIYTENPAAGSLLENTNNPQQLLFPSNLTTLTLESKTNTVAGLQALYPGLAIGSVSNYFALVVTTNAVIYLTNFPGSPFGTISTVVAFSPVTNIQQFFSYTYDNIVIITNHPNTPAVLQTITVAPPNGSAAGSPPVTTISTKNIVLTNVPSGEFYVLPAGSCGYNFIQTLQTIVTPVTNNLISTVNGNLSYSQNLITYFTNHVYAVAPCTLDTPTARLYSGVQRLQFVRGNFDSLLGQNFLPVTNTYTMTVWTNSQTVNQTFQRIVTAPDFLYSAADFAPGPSTGPAYGQVPIQRSISFDISNIGAQEAGPGVINSPTTITLNKVGIVFVNQSPSFLSDLNHGLVQFVWGSFDGTTNDPVVYPNGTSLANLMSEILIQINPSTLPVAHSGSAYSVQLSVTGGQSPYVWSLPSGSQLPGGTDLDSDWPDYLQRQPRDRRARPL